MCSITYQPIDQGAGLFHMLPNNFRYYCEGAPSVAAAFLAEFGGDAGCDTDNPCTCGTDAAAGLVIQRPEFSVSSAIWWMTNGAAALMHGTCPDVRGASDEGLGASPPRACFVAPCGALCGALWRARGALPTVLTAASCCMDVRTLRRLQRRASRPAADGILFGIPLHLRLCP